MGSTNGSQLIGRQGGGSDALVVMTSELAPIVEAWVSAEVAQTDQGVEVYRVDQQPRRHGVIQLLEHRSGVGARNVWRIRRREARFTSLRIADALLTAIDQVQAFHDGRVTVVPNPQWSVERWMRWQREEGRGCGPWADLE